MDANLDSDDDLDSDLDDDSDPKRGGILHSTSKRVRMIFSVMASPNRIDILRILNSKFVAKSMHVLFIFSGFPTKSMHSLTLSWYSRRKLYVLIQWGARRLGI